MRLVFVNLLSNAVKYFSTRPRPTIEIGTVENGRHEHVVFVRDNGIGFEMAYVDKLFGVFQRLHRADVRPSDRADVLRALLSWGVVRSGGAHSSARRVSGQRKT